MEGQNRKWYLLPAYFEIQCCHSSFLQAPLQCLAPARSLLSDVCRKNPPERIDRILWIETLPGFPIHDPKRKHEWTSVAAKRRQRPLRRKAKILPRWITNLSLLAKIVADRQ